MRPKEEAIGRWLSLKRERGCLPTTIAQYRWVVRRALTRLAQAGRTTNPARWSADDARFLRRRLGDDPWQLAILADLARFSRNFVFHEVGLPKRGPPTRVRWLSEEQARAVLDVTRKDRMLRLVALLGIGQGLRRVEWLRMRVEDIDVAGARILVRGKGRGQPKMAWMPMHPALPDALRDYLWWRDRKVRRMLRRNPLTPVPPELFLHRRGEALIPYGGGGANRWMLIVQRRLGELGVAVKLSTHMLRRSGATLLEKTLLNSPETSRDGVYRSVQEFLRHENLATTMRYLEADPSRQRRAMDVFGQALNWEATGAAVASTGIPRGIEPRPGAPTVLARKRAR
ncbi:MAG: tyrosine-type recombinase/integrase [Thermoplasmata archaeon]